MPGVGTNTALAKYVTDVLPTKYIYEFDLKGFFNEVSIPRVLQMLNDRGMPLSTIRKLFNILAQTPQNID
jgi:hypothetical protein